MTPSATQTTHTTSSNGRGGGYNAREQVHAAAGVDHNVSPSLVNHRHVQRIVEGGSNVVQSRAWEEIDKPEKPIACACRRTDIAKKRGGHEARREDEGKEGWRGSTTEKPIACAYRRTDRRTDTAKERGGHEARREDEERRREE
jgi:hypothetical protein